MHSFVPPFREAKFCGVPSCVFDKLGCAAGEERLRNSGIGLSVTYAPSISVRHNHTVFSKLDIFH
jgi:hypothetical protein